ncbi:siphovirus ReqiPepy6 Gp37-like family protein [Streptomyces hirsutus]|uniref:siphovirus ReqiPepy6 Gp37-like family protein n=1 Tax=Streptomyces hirsutus TaxID=35620 RepID=UPI0036ADC03F
MAIQLLVTDRNLNVLGDPITGWGDLSCHLNFNVPAAGSVRLPARPEVMALLQPGNRVVLIRDQAVWCAGPLEEPQDYTWDTGENAGVGTVTARWTDDLGRIAGYLTYPEPAKAWTAQTIYLDESRKFSGVNSETIIRALVSENCGPGALAARRIERLVLDTAAGVGTNQTVSTRFEPLLDACRTAAVTDGLGFRTRQVGDQIRFGVYQPRDRTGLVRFSRGLGNLRRLGFTLGAPTGTSALVMGGGDPAQQATPPNVRFYTEVASGAAATWYRVERLVQESSTDDDSEGLLTLAARRALDDDAAQVSLSTETVDTEDIQAGRDYGLGDRVAVELPTGMEVTDIVRSIRLEATPEGGERVTSVIGTSDQTTETRMVRTVRDLAYRLGRIEARGR